MYVSKGMNLTKIIENSSLLTQFPESKLATKYGYFYYKIFIYGRAIKTDHLRENNCNIDTINLVETSIMSNERLTSCLPMYSRQIYLYKLNLLWLSKRDHCHGHKESLSGRKELWLIFLPNNHHNDFTDTNSSRNLNYMFHNQPTNM